jgi:ATP-dependent Clp protease ATP-binding subunit ClpA
MFSASVEMLLHVAYREAVSRRHTHLTLEHLLYVLALSNKSGDASQSQVVRELRQRTHEGSMPYNQEPSLREAIMYDLCRPEKNID